MRITIILAATLLLCSCGAPRPLVDTKNVNQAKYQQDLEECQAYAKSSWGAGTGAAVGAVGGAAVGEVLGRTTGNMRNRGHLAGGGAAMGALSGASKGAQHQRQIVQRCLAGRGYNVLD
jgi:outer membrane lipoprotein SlyB